MSLPPPSARQARIIWLALTGLAIAVVVSLVAALVWGLGVVVQMLSPVLWPLAVAGVLAYLLHPVVDFFERRRVSRPPAIVGVFVIAFLLIRLGFCSIVPPLGTEKPGIAARISHYTPRAPG